MPGYDFHQLSSYDLEKLVRDLLQAEWGSVLESFKSGRDRGIDVRYAVGGNNTIVQVKHYLKTGMKGLLRDLQDEVPKVKKLAPKRYMIATSVALNPDDKDAIVNMFGSNVLAKSDVLGQDDLNNLLGLHAEIEQNHYKLWLASRAVLDRVLHNAEITQSEFKVRQVYEKAKRYVASNAYHKAFQMLNEHRVAIISGPPGVGKTTLADLLLYQHLEKGYQAILIQRDIAEGLKLYSDGKPQIFYFDDFMGATFLGDRPAGISAVQDQALLNFISMVRQSPHARLILTTREHIYSQALSRSERLRQSDLDDLRIVLHMPSYSYEARARILYNHLWFSELPHEYIAELLRNQFYLAIAKHERFNPRLIEWLSSYRRVKNVPVKDYQRFIGALLHNPFEIWHHAYSEEVTHAGRSLLLAIHSLAGNATANRLRSAFGSLHTQRSLKYGYSTRPDDFEMAVRETVNVFIKPTGPDAFAVLDPSVLDLMNEIARRAPENAVDVMKGAIEFGQIKQIWSLANADNGVAIIGAVRDAASQLSSIILRLAVADRRVPVGGGVAYIGPSFEDRLSIIVGMAERLQSPAIFQIVSLVFQRLTHELKTERMDLVDAVQLVRTLETAKQIPDRVAIVTAIRKEMVEETADGCRGDELREVLSVLDTTDPSSEEVTAARSAFQYYKDGRFHDDLHDCRSDEQFKGLIEDLELFRDELKVDVDDLTLPPSFIQL